MPVLQAGIAWKSAGYCPCDHMRSRTTISVDDIRQQVNNDIVIKPYSSKYKIYIIPEADLMSVQAQNALLKTIEEPPEYAVIMLLTENAEVLLPTIRLEMCYDEAEKYQGSACEEVSDGADGDPRL